VPVESERVDARRRRVFLAAVVAGGLAAVLIGVLGVVVLIRELEKRSPDPLSRVQARYQSIYDTCVRHGVAPSACAKRASTECVIDPFFKDDDNAVSDIGDVCVGFKHRRTTSTGLGQSRRAVEIRLQTATHAPRPRSTLAASPDISTAADVLE
jgi:hypothetical protein